MKIIRNKQVVDDPWQQLSDDQSLPGGDIIVSLSRWQAEKQDLLKRGAGLGVQLLGSDKVEEIADDLDKLSVISLDFARFTDGRGYTQARLLRDKYHYAGAIRAVGDVRRDQIDFMHRCGITEFMPAGHTNAEDALKAFNEISNLYQSDSLNNSTIRERRGESGL